MSKNTTIIKISSSKHNIFTARAGRKSFAPYIIISSLLACAALYYVEQRIGVNYIVKTGIKLLMFLTIPGIYYFLSRDKNIYISSPYGPRERGLLTGLFSGLIFFVVLIAAYYLLQSFIDFKTIMGELENKLQINPMNFIFVGIYITLGNSFIEEFFFRGFVFLGIYKTGRNIAAYLYSSLLFSLYHIMIFRYWFTPQLFLLALLGLFVVGLLFDWMDTKSKNFLNSWIAHIFGDAAIILIGLKMFGILNF